MAAARNDIAEVAKPFVEQIQDVFATLESMKGEYMARCKTKRKEIKEIYQVAKDAGINTTALKNLIKRLDLEEKIMDLTVDLDIDEAAAYKELAEKLGALGVIAAKTAGFATGSTDADDVDIRPDDLKARERARQNDAGVRADEKQLETVGRGITKPN